MPTYEYACASCGNQWEEIQKISADPVTECPKCHQQTAKRQISGGNFILKGGGWYADLYSSSKGGSKKSEGAESKTETKSETKTETKSETKSETKTEAKPETKSNAPSGSGGGSGGSGKSD